MGRFESGFFGGLFHLLLGLFGNFELSSASVPISAHATGSVPISAHCTGSVPIGKS